MKAENEEENGALEMEKVKRVPLSLDELIAKRKAEQEAQSKVSIAVYLEAHTDKFNTFYLVVRDKQLF